MPTLRPPVTGSFVITLASVMYGPPSFGHWNWIGRRSRSGSGQTTSWQAPERTTLGRASATPLRRRSACTLSLSPSGGLRSSSSAISSPIESNSSRPSASSIRRSVPNWLIKRGIFEPLTLLQSKAGPPPLSARSAISVISRYESTSWVISTSSPSRRSNAIQSRRSFGPFIGHPPSGAGAPAAD